MYKDMLQQMLQYVKIPAKDFPWKCPKWVIQTGLQLNSLGR